MGAVDLFWVALGVYFQDKYGCKIPPGVAGLFKVPAQFVLPVFCRSYPYLGQQLAKSGYPD